jgi:hypothetical protein
MMIAADRKRLCSRSRVWNLARYCEMSLNIEKRRFDLARRPSSASSHSLARGFLSLIINFLRPFNQGTRLGRW